MGTKVWQIAASPAQWSRPLEAREVTESGPVHQELIGAVASSPLTDEVGMLYHVEIVGDDGDDGVDENGDSDSADTGEGGEGGEGGGPATEAMGPAPDPGGAGPSGPPSFAPISTPPTLRGPKPVHPVAHFRHRLAKGDPHAHHAYHALRRKAVHHPQARAALQAIHSPRIISGGAVPDAAGSILRAVLAPVAWGMHGVGRLSTTVGTHLSKLSRKL